ncbi:leucine-rich repeat domain-containing protein [Fluviispira multicolorata]|uniref:Leucine-rich repeat domain-containing protein n=1 Tax=Fluviispira multicolorata TaxID=2654512 RepID=A0A833JI49_9BACT|nr:leucine-rich repeat domain-containing protein [Fluviispira multicolorata]KAB8033707.1 hypothetical protein GCL57_03095 [Fluviispira multicolorata]
MKDANRKKNCNSLKIIKIFTAYLFIMHLSAFASPDDILVNIFFNDKNVLTEKSNSDFLIEMQGIALNEKLSPFFKDSFINIENKSDSVVCEKSIDFRKKSILFHDPQELLTTFTQCKYKITSQKTKKSIALRIGLNRTFRSWCKRKETSGKEIKKTVNAILDILHAKCCNDEYVKNSLVNAKMLNLADKEIVDVSPIGSFTNLRALWLNNNMISNINPLTSLKNLFVISLSNNNLSNISAIKYLKNSRWVFVSKNHITKINAITQLENMRVFIAEDNDIVDIKPLLNLKMMNVKVRVDDNPFDLNICKDYLSNHSKMKRSVILDDLCSDFVKIVPTNIVKVEERTL